MKMDKQRLGRNAKTLWSLVLCGIAYIGILHYLGSLTGADKADGILSVVFGLYLCSHPAANLVDMLFLARRGGRQFSSSRSALFWIALNGMVLLIGWIVIFMGTGRLISRAD